MPGLKEFFRGKKILITGHTGFKGSWLAYILKRWGADVSGVSLPPHTKPNSFEILGLDSGIKNYYADVKDFGKLKEIFNKEKPEIVFHLAAQAILRRSYDDPLGTFSTNILGTVNILQAIKEEGCVNAAVIVTTDKVYDEIGSGAPYKETDALGGIDPYSGSKACADIVSNVYIQSFFNPQCFGRGHRTLIATARAGNVVGGGDWGDDRLVPDIVRAIYEKNGEITVRNPDYVRPWHYVLGPLKGYLLLAMELYGGNVKAVGAWNFGPEPENFVPVEFIVQKGIEILGRGSYKIIPDNEKREADTLKLDSSKAKEALGWRPVFTIMETLSRTFNWYSNYYEKKASPQEITDNQIDEFFS
jgi:CDP-glucose 4,6-dehydratase